MSKAATPSLDTLDGVALRKMFAAATDALEAQAEAINALNVFPVPDGDTGTNMLLTMRAALEEAAGCPSEAAGEIGAAMAKGSLMGARGNSGVILSQILRGFGKSIEGKARITGGDIAVALQEASAQAYKVVTEPVEGTILTVIREVAAATTGQIVSGTPTPAAVLDVAASSAKTAVARTPFQLDVLRENGVVDAGGEGLSVILQGALWFVIGAAGPLKVAAGQPSVGALPIAERTEDEGPSAYGFCTEVLVKDCSVDAGRLRDRLSSFGSSVLVAGDATLAKVHLHTFDTDSTLAYLRSVGSVAHVKIDNIDEQHEAFSSRLPLLREVGVVAVVSGDGLADLFRSLGVSAIVPGGQTMNPSARDLLDAAGTVAAETVILLPNNANVVATARQAQEIGSAQRIVVVPTQDLPQGVAAMLAFNYEQDAEANATAMDQARLAVRTGEITQAVRETRLEGRTVKRGHFIGLAGGQLVVAHAQVETAVERLLERIAVKKGDTVTLYFGGDVSQADAKALAHRVCQRFPGVDVESFAGGHPLYHYLVSAE